MVDSSSVGTLKGSKLALQKQKAANRPGSGASAAESSKERIGETRQTVGENRDTQSPFFNDQTSFSADTGKNQSRSPFQKMSQEKVQAEIKDFYAKGTGGKQLG